MSLGSLLKVETRFITEQQEKATRLAEREWIRAGCPRERCALIALLENIILACSECGYEYPPVLLKRKKQLERGEWTPQKPVSASSPNANSSHHPAINPDWIRQAEKLWEEGK
jgi:hypothetical protein